MKIAAIMLLVPLWLNAEINFEKEIAPIIETHCISCHNDEKTKGKFNISTREKMLTHKSAVIAGDVSKSDLINLISGDEPDMPPKGEPLNAQQIETLKKWIVSGAEWPTGRTLKYNPKKDFSWWSLKPIEPQTVPAGRHPIDYFIDNKLLEKNLKSNKNASPEVLIRRLTYDLTGLPPTPEEVNTFVKLYNINPDKTWNSKVDELLSRKSFGEKWGQHWLDIARYADTHGYDKDKMRQNAWPYRDYIIRSLNDDKPYDKFIKEQIAGDVIYPNTEDGVIALGFLSAGPWDYVGHVEVSEAKMDGKIARHMDRDEMVAATFNAFMSTTVQCAQCHHHKFDPIHQEDYYRLHAVFSAVDRAEREYSVLAPNLIAKKKKLEKDLATINSKIIPIEQKLNKIIASKTESLQKKIDKLKAEHSPIVPNQYGYHSLISNSQSETKWVQVNLQRPTKVEEIEIIPAFDNFNNIGAGFGFPVRYKIEVASNMEMTKDLKVVYQSSEDEINPGSKPVSFSVGGAEIRSVRVTAIKLSERSKDYIFALGELKVLTGNNRKNITMNGTVSAKDSTESVPRWSKQNLIDGQAYKSAENSSANTELNSLNAKVEQIKAEIKKSQDQQQLNNLIKERDSLKKSLSDFPAGKKVYAASTDFRAKGNFKPTNGNLRPIHLLHRGDIKSKGPRMTPGAPALWESAQEVFIKDTNWPEGKGREKLAEYLTSNNNPLVWRSITNRLFQWTLGNPIVGTPNDFGKMGMKPTHPELLDFLAYTLKSDKKKSLKSIIKILVTSKAYRRSSEGNPKNASIDSNNQYLWKFNRRRLTAEEFRDSLLFIGDKLKENDPGGAGFKDFIVEKPQHSPHYQYHLHDPYSPTAHRRTIYRFVVRSQPQPLLTTLDCADPSLSVPKRDESTTALQALAQWNNKFVEAMANIFAEKHKNSKVSIDDLCMETLGRLPTPQEKNILNEQLNQNGIACVARILFNMSAFNYVN